MWSITKVTDEDDWFEGYVRLALSVKPPSLPQKRHRLGATTVSWFETEPGVAFIDARGGTPDDRVLATRYLKSMLAGHGYRVAQYEIDYGQNWRELEPEVMQRLVRGGGSKDDCGEMSAAWYATLKDHGHRVQMMHGSNDQGDDHAWLVVNGEKFDPAPHTNPGVTQEWEHTPNDTDWPSIAPYRQSSVKTAKWSDIMAKAKRLIQSGKVQLLRNGAENVVGSVIGDHGTYQTEISREDPNSQSMTQWQCECPWDQYAWQRTRQWKKYEGRPCAHVLATWWKSQGQPTDEDAHPAMQQQQAPAGQMPPTMPGRTFLPGQDPMEQQGVLAPGFQPAMPAQGILPGLPGGAPMAPPGQAMGTPPIPGIPPQVLPPFPMEGQLEPPMPTPVSIPGAKPQSPLNPMQWPGGTLSSVQDGWDSLSKFAVSPFNEQPAGFQNGNMVQIVGTDMGVAEGPDPNNPLHGKYLDIKSNTRGLGEVMGMDTLPGMGEVVEVIFPLDKMGPLQPYHIRAWLRPDQLVLRPDVQRPGPMIKRRRTDGK